MSWSRRSRRQRTLGKAPHPPWHIQEDIPLVGRENNIWPGVQQAVFHQTLDPSHSQAPWETEVQGQLEGLWLDIFKRSISKS